MFLQFFNVLSLFLPTWISFVHRYGSYGDIMYYLCLQDELNTSIIIIISIIIINAGLKYPNV